MAKPNTINVQDMFDSLMTQTNALITLLKTIDPASEAYGIALNNLAKSFTILSGASMPSKGEKDGDK
jgi:hypothetical protein